ncbi:MAG: HEPN domain-containing protein [Metallosphaera prunae]|uniref:HEPN domain-containing protein n=1 Tax=Metallosphaera prunae TaxID=47304 RepID=UPI002273EC72|nr:HEPN domain-containing protein [Metallosphaera prunae]MCY0860909.1 HEPN domain-containing protein [Metallosphaera prunae]
MSFLRDRAEEFLDNARYSLGKGYYNLTLFNVEQFIQLYAKYLIYLKAGDFPKTHNILSLLERIEDLYEDKCNISVFRRDNKDFLYVIYFSYTQGRYFGTVFTRDDAERAVSLANKFRELGQCLTT